MPFRAYISSPPPAREERAHPREITYHPKAKTSPLFFFSSAEDSYLFLGEVRGIKAKWGVEREKKEEGNTRRLAGFDFGAIGTDVQMDRGEKLSGLFTLGPSFGLFLYGRKFLRGGGFYLIIGLGR